MHCRYTARVTHRFARYNGVLRGQSVGVHGVELREGMVCTKRIGVGPLHTPYVENLRFQDASNGEQPFSNSG